MAKTENPDKMYDFSRMPLGRRLVHAARSILGLREAVPASAGSDSDAGFRRITARSDKELSPTKWDKQMRVAHYLWLQNPMAARILELMADFVVGDGFAWQAPDEEVAAIVKRHWDDHDNAWALTQFDRYSEWALFGTWAPKVFVNPYNGHVKISSIDPNWIREVVPDVNVIGKASRLMIQKTNESGASPEPWDVIAIDDDPVSPTNGRLVGSVFYFTMNRLSFTYTGFSELFRLADWLDAFDQFVFSLLERINFLNAHLYDITLEGAEDTEVQERADELEENPPRPGGFRVHNEKEKWDTVTPEMNSAEVKEVADIIKMLILGSIGIPPHWFADPGDTNRATSQEMSGPILRKMKRKQAQWAAVIETILKFQVDQAIIARRLSPTKPDGTPRDLSVKAVPPDVSSKDALAFVDSLDKLTTTMANAIAEGFIKREDGARVWSQKASESGVDVPVADAAQVAQNLAAEQSRTQAQVQDQSQQAYAQYGTQLQQGVQTAQDVVDMVNQAHSFVSAALTRQQAGEAVRGSDLDLDRARALLEEAARSAAELDKAINSPACQSVSESCSIVARMLESSAVTDCMAHLTRTISLTSLMRIGVGRRLRKWSAPAARPEAKVAA